jgi:SAM-dependent methyltransferase
MFVIDWGVRAEERSQCPVCHVDGSKCHLLDVTFAPTNEATTHQVRLLHCVYCGARYIVPAVPVDYEHSDENGMRYYVEQGAGLDVMLEIFSKLDTRPINRYLEVGCSFGFAMEYARRSLGWQVLGFDPGFVAAAGKRMLGLPIKRRSFDKDAVPEGAFDVVFSSEVIEHLSEPDAFVESLRHGLADGGVLLMTTPDGDAVSPDLASELLIPILSPGQHLILYNATAIEQLLRRHGFTYVGVRKNVTQLQIVAAMTPLGVSASYFTRARYRDFLRYEFDIHREDRDLSACFGYRLLCEDVNSSAFSDAFVTYQRLRHLYKGGYGYDIEAADGVPIPSPVGLSLSAFGQKVPFNLCGIWYCRAIIAFLGDKDPITAVPYFSAAISVGGALRAVLQDLGTDDVSLANFCREAEIARLAALAQCDPRRGLDVIRSLRRNVLQDPNPAAHHHKKRAERRLFTDLANLGVYEVVEELVNESEGLFDDPVGIATADTAIAYGFYLLNHKRDPDAARRILSRVRAAMLDERSLKHNAQLVSMFQSVEIALLTASALISREEVLELVRAISVNAAALDADTFAEHMKRIRKRVNEIFTDLGYLALSEAQYSDPDRFSSR